MSRIIGGSILAVITGFAIGTALVGFILASGGYGSPIVIGRAGPAVAVAPPVAGPPAPPQPAPAGQQKAAPAAASEVKVVATDLKFAPNALTARTGEPIKVVLENKGIIEHDIAFPTLKADQPAAQLKTLAKPGQTTSLELTPSAAGKYEFVCTIPGHKEAGMKGTLTVR